MRRHITRTLLLGLILLGISQCTVQKRRYQPGFTFARHKSIGKPEAHRTSTTKKSERSETITVQAEPQIQKSEPEEAMMASGSKIIQFAKRKALKLLSDPDTCDVFIYRDGSELRVKIIDVGAKQTRYRRCDHPTGPVYVVDNSKLFMVRFADGRKQVMESQATTTAPTSTEKGKPASAVGQRNHPKADSSLALGILALLLCWVPLLGLIFGVIAVSLGSTATSEIRDNPTKYRGEGAAIAGMTLGYVAMAIQMLILIAIVASAI